jgi:hypothetical protein
VVEVVVEQAWERHQVQIEVEVQEVEVVQYQEL